MGETETTKLRAFALKVRALLERLLERLLAAVRALTDRTPTA